MILCGIVEGSHYNKWVMGIEKRVAEIKELGELKLCDYFRNIFFQRKQIHIRISHFNHLFF